MGISDEERGNMALNQAKSVLNVTESLMAPILDPDSYSPQQKFDGAYTGVVLAAFATELGLKAFLLRSGRFDKDRHHIHDLLSLYQDLKADERASVESKFSGSVLARAITSDSLLKVLTDHRDTFKTWRYLFEDTGSTVGPLQLFVSAKATIAAFEESTLE